MEGSSAEGQHVCSIEDQPQTVLMIKLEAHKVEDSKVETVLKAVGGLKLVTKSQESK